MLPVESKVSKVRPSVCLRSVVEGDLLYLQELLREPHVSRWFTEPEAWLHEFAERDGEFGFLRQFIVLCADRPIGYCQYYLCSDADELQFRSFPKRGTYSVDYMIGDPEYLEKGFGGSMVTALASIISSIPGSKLIVAQPEIGNIASIGLLRSVGFRYHENTSVLVLDIS